MKIGGRLGSRLVLLYCHCFHAVNFSESADFIAALAASSACEPSFAAGGVPEVYLNLATAMSKVQITPTRTNTVNPIRIH